jgi:hypothetical protein
LLLRIFNALQYFCFSGRNALFAGGKPRITFYFTV